jgi:hypothetical protein
MLKNYFIKNKKFVKNATKIKIKINKIHRVIFEIIYEVFWFYIFEKLPLIPSILSFEKFVSESKRFCIDFENYQMIGFRYVSFHVFLSD